MSALCIIPARGGSKRIPRKNIRPFNGRPILTYAVDAARESGCFDEIMVSTDDEEIARIGHDAGAQVPFLRSPETSNDHAEFVTVLLEVIEKYRTAGRTFDYLCCIYPTAALTQAAAIRDGYSKLTAEPSLSCVLPVVAFGYPIQRAVHITNGRLQMFQPENYHARSQDLQKAYHDAGQWYWLRTEKLHPKIQMLGQDTAGVVVSEADVQDIDNEDDWRMAELKYQMRQQAR